MIAVITKPYSPHPISTGHFVLGYCRECLLSLVRAVPSGSWQEVPLGFVSKAAHWMVWKQGTFPVYNWSNRMVLLNNVWTFVNWLQTVYSDAFIYFCGGTCTWVSTRRNREYVKWCLLMMVNGNIESCSDTVDRINFFFSFQRSWLQSRGSKSTVTRSF